LYSSGSAGIDVGSSRSNGFKVTDTAGLIGPGASTPGFRSWTEGGGINFLADASRWVGSNQNLTFGLTGDLHHSTAVFDTTVPVANAQAASGQSNTFTLRGSSTYANPNFYLQTFALADFSHYDFTNNFTIPGAHGSTNGNGYEFGGMIGKIFPLLTSLDSKKQPNIGDYALFLDASSHYAYRNANIDPFTDTTGLVTGAAHVAYNDFGAHLRLAASVLGPQSVWQPYIGVTMDRLVGVDATGEIPAQAALPADKLTFNPSPNFWGGELGLNVLTPGGVTFGARGFYQASADISTIGGNLFMTIPLSVLAANTDSGIRIAPVPGMLVKAPPPPPATTWSWAGLYLGGHVGGALNIAKFSDPFGTPISGDIVRSPGFLGGGQIGYNWQAPGSRWIFGVEADASLMSSDGSNVCFATSAAIVNTNCRVRPRATGAFTGRVGYAFGPDGRTLLYGKAGVAWAHDTIGMDLNVGGINPASAAAPLLSNSQSVTLWGGTVGVGVERALTPAWSVKVEYDYVDLGHSNIANLGNVSILPLPPFTIGVVAPGTSSVSQNIQEVKVGLNYKWGADPWASGLNASPQAFPNVLSSTGWEVEGGSRYFGSWGQFQKDFGDFKSLGLPNTSGFSRLTYKDLQTNSGEFFGRIDTPWNLFVKGYLGGGVTNNGHMNDEDNVDIFGPVVAAYSNTLSPAVDGNIRYGAIDGGYDFLRGYGYKVGAFGGYFAFNQTMNAFGCVVIASVNCTPNPLPTSGSPTITETDKWQAVRIGLSAEAMLSDRVKISGEAAYLPWVSFNGLDQHFIGNTGVLTKLFPASGTGNGVQLEALVSYYLTRQWSVGLGGRYWGMWTTPNGQFNCTVGCAATPTAPQYFRAQVEQIGAFVQTSYKFDWGGSAIATR